MCVAQFDVDLSVPESGSVVCEHQRATKTPTFDPAAVKEGKIAVALVLE